MGYLVLLRHGESVWNVTNRFTGWVDVPLSEKGFREALAAAGKLKSINFDVAFTSKLRRAQENLLVVFRKQDRTGIFVNSGWGKHKFEDDEIPIYVDETLNERFYGKLQGLNKDFARKKWGEKKVFAWRRSWDVRPPGGESLKDVSDRVVPFFKRVMKDVRKGKNVIVSAHGNSLRAMVKFIENFSEEDVPFLNLKTGKPVVYEYKMKRLVRKDKCGFDRPISYK